MGKNQAKGTLLSSSILLFYWTIVKHKEILTDQIQLIVPVDNYCIHISEQFEINVKLGGSLEKVLEPKGEKDDDGDQQ